MNVDFSFCLIFNKELYFLWNRTGFSWNTIHHTPDEAMSVGLAKACVPGKNCSVPEKIEFFIEEQPWVIVK